MEARASTTDYEWPVRARALKIIKNKILVAFPTGQAHPFYSYSTYKDVLS